MKIEQEILSARARDNNVDPDAFASKKRKKYRALEDIEEIQERAVKQQKRI